MACERGGDLASIGGSSGTGMQPRVVGGQQQQQHRRFVDGALPRPCDFPRLILAAQRWSHQADTGLHVPAARQGFPNSTSRRFGSPDLALLVVGQHAAGEVDGITLLVGDDLDSLPQCHFVLCQRRGRGAARGVQTRLGFSHVPLGVACVWRGRSAPRHNPGPTIPPLRPSSGPGRRCAHLYTASGEFCSASTTASMVAGSTSGSSPWMLMTMSYDSFSELTASSHRSVPGVAQGGGARKQRLGGRHLGRRGDPALSPPCAAGHLTGVGLRPYCVADSGPILFCLLERPLP